jgi:hypothetical protein
MKDSKIANNGGPGQVDAKRFKEMAQIWGKLPEKERAQAILDMTRDLPPQYRARIEEYYRKSAGTNNK